MNKTILVVDDEPAILELTTHRLESQGYQTIAIETGREVIQVFKKEKSISLFAVLLDLKLLDTHGFEVLKEIKRTNPELPVIIITGERSEEEARRGMELGALDYITKPVDFDYLYRILKMQE